MQAIILQENLNKGLSVVSRIISSKTTLPILNNILISAEEGKLKLTATNLETGINLWLPAKKEKAGKLTIPAKDLTEFVSSLPAGKIKLKKQQERLQLISRSYKAVFNGASTVEFPKVPSLRDKVIPAKKLKKIELETGKFVKAIKHVCFSAATDETRPVLTGVRISCIGGDFQLVATDGYRLSVKTMKLRKKTDIPALIIPAKALIEVARIIGGEEGEEKEKKLKVAILEEGKQIIFSFNNIEVVARLIEGEFPDFTKIIPEKGETKIIIDKEDFNRAIKASSIFARRSANIIKLKVESSKLKVMANAPEVGKNEVELSVKFQGKETQIAFNCRFLQDFINSYDKETFVLELSGVLKPGLFRTEKDSSFLHIIMPVRLQEKT